MTPAPPPPRRFGRYEILRPLARGGMAELFVARRVGPEGVAKRLCIKRIRRELARNPRFLDLFVAEARISTSLAHGNIVQVFDFGRVDNDYFLALEYVPGRDLATLLGALRGAGGALPPPLAAHLGRELCRALDYAHRRRDEAGRPLALVHRDVTPRNILLSWDGEVKLADFGVTVVGELGAGGVRGTPAYMAPEQARGEALDHRADLYSLGLVLFEAVAGHRAYDGDDPEALLAAARRAAPPPPPETLPPELRAVITRALAAAPADRFEDAAAMQAALERYLKGIVDETPPARALTRLLAETFPGEAARDAADAAVELPPDAGLRTALSHAGTLDADEADPAAPDAAAPRDTPPPPAPATPRGARARRLALVGTLGATLAVAAWLWPAAHDRPPPGNAPRAHPGATSAAAAPPSRPAASPAPRVPATAPAPRPAAPAVIAGPRRRGGRANATVAGVPARPGTLELNCRPWCEIVIDGRPAGESPLVGRALSPGRHAVRVRNPALGLSRSLLVEIRSGELTRHVVDLAGTR